MTTAKQFNQILRNFYRSFLPEAIREKDITSHKLHVYDQVFGVGVFGYEKELISPELIVFQDTVPGVPGVKALSLREKQFAEILKVMGELQLDPVFIKEVKDPAFRKVLTNVEDRLVKLFADGQAKCKILTIEENDVKIKAMVENYTKAYPIFNFITLTPKYSKFLKRVKNTISAINHAKDSDRYKTAIEIKDKIEQKVGSAFSIVAWASVFSATRALYGRIPVLLGPCPLKHADYIEIARSGKILKFRATGSVFLASQEGGADAIKIEGTMYKAEFLIMFMLWGLFIYGQSKFREMENIPLMLPKAKDVFEIRKLNDLIMTDTNLQKPSYEFHQTFPFVSRHFIIPNCYIETISIEDKLPLKDVLKYSILLRTYDKPKEVNRWADKKGRVLYGVSNKTMSAKLCELSLNAGWRFLSSTGWLLDETEWKIGSAMKEGVMDTYYDVDWSSIATVTYLNLMGVAT